MEENGIKRDKRKWDSIGRFMMVKNGIEVYKVIQMCKKYGKVWKTT